MDRKEEIIACPDDSGWYWFKAKKNSPVVIAFVNDDGVATTFAPCGSTEELDDLIGFWEPTESNKL